VHDDLYARALVLGDGLRQAAIVCLDLVGLDFTLADEIRAAIHRRTGIAATLLNCTHTHSAPFTIPWSVLGWSWLSNEGRPWRSDLVDKVTEVVYRASTRLFQVSLRLGRAPAQVGANRRLRTQQGMTMKPNPSGAIAPWTDVLRVDNPDGQPIAILFSHAAHPVIVHASSTLISADYAGYAVEAVREHFPDRRWRASRQALPMFAQGCGGNINAEPLRGGFEAAERAGRALADAVTQAAAESKLLTATQLRTSSVTIHLPFHDFPAAQDCQDALNKAEASLAQAQAKETAEKHLWSSMDTVLCLRDLMRRVQARQPQSLRFEINTLAIGNDWCLLAMPHEVFVDYQLWVEQASPFRHNMVLAYTNGCESYIPTDKDFALGGYEAMAFPQIGAALRYRHRVALRPGIEPQIKKAITELWTHKESM
jgi:hypothetical protein